MQFEEVSKSVRGVVIVSPVGDGTVFIMFRCFVSPLKGLGIHNCVLTQRSRAGLRLCRPAGWDPGRADLQVRVSDALSMNCQPEWRDLLFARAGSTSYATKARDPLCNRARLQPCREQNSLCSGQQHLRKAQMLLPFQLCMRRFGTTESRALYKPVCSRFREPACWPADYGSVRTSKYLLIPNA